MEYSNLSRITSQTGVGDRTPQSQNFSNSNNVYENSEQNVNLDSEQSQGETVTNNLENKFDDLLVSSEGMNLRRYDAVRREFLLILGLSVIISIVIIVLIIISSSYWEDISRPASSENGGTLGLYSIHAIFMSLSTCFFSAYGILMYRVLPEPPMWVIKWIHGFIFGFASIFLLFGLMKSFDNFEIFFLEDFSTIHSWVGIVVVLLFTIEMGTGCVFFCYSDANLRINSGYQRVHRKIGYGVLILSSATLVTGMDRMICLTSGSNSTNKSSSRKTYLNVMSSLMITFYLIIFLMIFTQRYERKARPNWTCIFNNSSNCEELSKDSSKTMIQKSLLFKKQDTVGSI